MDTGILMKRSWMLLAVSAASLCAYNPPVDTVGPLTVRIDGPSVLESAETASYAAVLENQADRPLAVRLRLGVIDGWKAIFRDPPELIIASRSTTRVEFAVTPDAHGFAAHYPVHLYAEFEHQGQKLAAHPVLIVEAKFGTSARPPEALEWRPIEVVRDSGLALWRAPVYRAVVHVFNRPPLVMAVGWQGSDPASRATLQWSTRVQRGDTREAIAMHPPYSQGLTGSILVEVPLRLPPQPAKLRFATAVRTPDAGSRGGDGVTFRVRVAALEAPPGTQGEVVFERHSNSQVWVEGEADLRAFAGHSIRLQLESHPGPNNDTAFDLSYWGEPVLIVGDPPPEPPFPPSSEAGSRLLGRAGEYDVRLWPGRRGLLDGAMGFFTSGKQIFLRGFSVRVSGSALQDWRSPIILKDVSWEQEGSRLRARHRFQDFDLLGEVWIENGALRVRFAVENTPEPQPWKVVYIEDAAAGPWSAQIRRVYAGPGNVLDEPQAFRLSFDGHRLATSFVGLDFAGNVSMVQAVDAPPHEFEFDPARAIASLHAAHALTFALIPCESVWAGVKIWREINGLKASDGVAKLAGRFVFDLWGGNYAPTSAALRRAAAYGLVDSLVVWHNWQRWGYDYRLPDIFPPNPKLGSEQEFLDLVRAAKENGMLFAPHDNYIDFYPDAEGFSYDHISFQPSGQPIKAWYNRGRDAQSYRWLTDHFRPYLERNLALIRESFAPTAYFIDVWSSMGPFDAWTRDGKLIDRITTRNAWGAAFSWIRRYLGDDAPQISESGHDQLIGWLDGAQTNHLRVDRPPSGEYSWAVWNISVKDAERIPWFDMAHHDRFALHGAGYESRYASGLDRTLHGIYSDDYMTTEVLTGHPPMVSEAFSRNAVRKYWLLHDLGRALALRRIEAVEFIEGDLHRQRVLWSGGGEVWVNRGTSDWACGNHILPPYGFYARVPVEEGVVEAAIERRDGVIVDWAKSPQAWFLDARPVVTDRLPIRVALESIEPAGERRFVFKFRWDAASPAPLALRVFVHFVDANGEIRFQGDHAPSVPVTTWKGVVYTTATVTIPPEFQAGSQFDVRIGFWDPATGARYLPEGPEDGTKRIRLGSIRLEEGGLAWTPFDPGPDPALLRLNPEGRRIDFEGAATSVSVRLTPSGESLWITQLPQNPAGELRVRMASLPWPLPAMRLAHVRDESGNILRTLAFDRVGDEIVLPLEPGVFAYELR